MRVLLYATGLTALMAVALTLLMFDAIIAGVDSVGVGALAMMAIASLALSYLFSMPWLRMRAQRLDLGDQK